MVPLMVLAAHILRTALWVLGQSVVVVRRPFMTGADISRMLSVLDSWIAPRVPYPTGPSSCPGSLVEFFSPLHRRELRPREVD